MKALLLSAFALSMLLTVAPEPASAGCIWVWVCDAAGQNCVWQWQCS